MVHWVKHWKAHAEALKRIAQEEKAEREAYKKLSEERLTAFKERWGLQQQHQQGNL